MPNRVRNHHRSAPPAYNTSSFPPAYQYPLNVPFTVSKGLPLKFLVGSMHIPPLITSTSIIAHLRLLAAFHLLEHWVSAPRRHSASADPSNPLLAVRWRVFLHQAVWRFEIWLKRVIKARGSNAGALRDQEIPPLDVLLVWHTYLLNPRVYADDTKRVYRELAAVGGLPLERVASQINPTTLEFEATPAQAEFWERMTTLPHEPPTPSLHGLDELTVECPRCMGPPIKVPWLCEPRFAPNGYVQGTGWCQNQFSVQCGNCQFNVTRESIAVGRFAADIAAAMVDKNEVLPGTLFDPCECTVSNEIAQRITALLLQPFADLPPARQAIGEHLGWSFSGIEKSFTEARHTLIDAVHAMDRHDHLEPPESPKLPGLPTRGRKELSARILEAQKSVGSDAHGTWLSFGPRLATMLASYRDNPTPFSLDLVGAVIRQTGFTSKAFNLGWLDPSNPNPPVVPSITRYHNFLHLLSRYGYFLVPTFDIDLGWHTHQLAGGTYMSDTEKYVGRYVDHEDKVEEGVLSNGFDTTSRVWESTFHTRYSACEPLRSAAITFPNIKNLTKKLSFDRSNPKDSGPDLTTYPSEHSNTVVLRDRLTSERRLERERKRGKHKQRATEQPFTKKVYGPNGVPEHPSTAHVVTFGELGISGWALFGAVDQNVLNSKTVAMGQCCAGFGLPYYGRPLWVTGARSPTGREGEGEGMEIDTSEDVDPCYRPGGVHDMI